MLCLLNWDTYSSELIHATVDGDEKDNDGCAFDCSATMMTTTQMTVTLAFRTIAR